LLPGPVLSAEKGDFRFGTNPRIKQSRYRKPVKIKLKRMDDGKYSWELTGDSVEAVIRADRRLRGYIKKKKQ
jgi:hypothetical protein